jgi:hypothetical protein
MDINRVVSRLDEEGTGAKGGVRLGRILIYLRPSGLVAHDLIIKWSVTA